MPFIYELIVTPLKVTDKICRSQSRNLNDAINALINDFFRSPQKVDLDEWNNCIISFELSTEPKKIIFSNPINANTYEFVINASTDTPAPIVPSYSMPTAAMTDAEIDAFNDAILAKRFTPSASQPLTLTDTQLTTLKRLTDNRNSITIKELKRLINEDEWRTIFDANTWEKLVKCFVINLMSKEDREILAYYTRQTALTSFPRPMMHIEYSKGAIPAKKGSVYELGDFSTELNTDGSCYIIKNTGGSIKIYEDRPDNAPAHTIGCDVELYIDRHTTHLASAPVIRLTFSNQYEPAEIEKLVDKLLKTQPYKFFSAERIVPKYAVLEKTPASKISFGITAAIMLASTAAAILFATGVLAPLGFLAPLALGNLIIQPAILSAIVIAAGSYAVSLASAFIGYSRLKFNLGAGIRHQPDPVKVTVDSPIPSIAGAAVADTSRLVHTLAVTANSASTELDEISALGSNTPIHKTP